MLVIRKRLIFWLIKAYIKKSGKIILLSFLLGLLIFFTLIFASKYFTIILPAFKRETIGVVGAYKKNNLPEIITNKFSRGLTKIADDGKVKPDLAQNWEIKDHGKTYIFHLKKNEYFSDGKNVTSDKITYNFSDVTVDRPDKYTIDFKLKDAYAPFLVTMSKGVFEKGYIGVGNYKIENINLNGDFVQSLTIASVKNQFDTIHFQFYPSQEAMKLAFLLGEITEASGLTDPIYNNVSFDKMANTKVEKVNNYSRLVTLFFNTSDETVSDKLVRIALTYALPVSYTYGQRNYLPYSPESFYYNSDVPDRGQDLDHAKLLLDTSSVGSSGAKLKLTIQTMRKYDLTAHKIADSWKKVGVQTTVEDVDGVPDRFQIFLGDFTVPQDPDQYTLWHSSQANNITQYKNLRIDKLLEDGRKTVDTNQRKSIYGDFQKYLLEDAPAAFLYFPYEYDVIRK